MGKARLLGQYRKFTPNRYADIRRRPTAVQNRLDRMARQKEELEAVKMRKKEEMENEAIRQAISGD